MHEQIKELDPEEIRWSSGWGQAIMKQKPWKAPGPDGIAAFWLRAFPGLMERAGEILGKLLEEGQVLPRWLVRGRTVLIPKKVGAMEPGDFRPITCLNTLYKCATGALQVILWRHVAPTGLIPEEQKALQKGRRGCLDAM